MRGDIEIKMGVHERAKAQQNPHVDKLIYATRYLATYPRYGTSLLQSALIHHMHNKGRQTLKSWFHENFRGYYFGP